MPGADEATLEAALEKAEVEMGLGRFYANPIIIVDLSLSREYDIPEFHESSFEITMNFPKLKNSKNWKTWGQIES